MTSPSAHRRAAPFLGAVLAMQMAWIGFDHLRQDRIVPMEVGEEVAFNVKPLVQPASVGLHFQPPCRVAFACSRDCIWCARRADRYAKTERDTIPQDLRPLWLITADSAGALAWAEKHGIPPSEVMALMPKEGSWFSGRKFGHIWFSPMRLVVQSDLTLRDARPVDGLLNAYELTQVCESGGLAPHSIEEFLALMQAADAE